VKCGGKESLLGAHAPTRGASPKRKEHTAKAAPWSPSGKLPEKGQKWPKTVKIAIVHTTRFDQYG